MRCSLRKDNDFAGNVTREPVAKRRRELGSSTPLGSGFMGGRLPGVPLRGDPRLGSGTALRCGAWGRDWPLGTITRSEQRVVVARPTVIRPSACHAKPLTSIPIHPTS